MTAWIDSFMSTLLREPGIGRRKTAVGWQLAGMLTIGFLLTLFSTVSNAGTVEGTLSLSTEGGGSGEVFLGFGETVRLLKPGFAKERDELRRRILPRVREADRLADAALVKVLRSSMDERRRLEKSYREAENRRRKVRRDYEVAVNTLISKLTVASAKTDEKGRFRLEGIPPGNYILNSQKLMPELGLFYYWLVKVQVKEQDGKPSDLTRENATSLYY